MVNFKDDFNEAILITKKNHPDYNMAINIEREIENYIKSIGKINFDSIMSNFSLLFSRQDNSTNKPIRGKIMSYYKDQGMDIVLCFFEMLHEYALNELTNINNGTIEDSRYYWSLAKYVGNYEAIIKYKNKIYEDSFMLYSLINHIHPILERYINNISKSYSINTSSINIYSINKNVSTNIATNLKNGVLVNSYSGELSNGKIKVASYIGYTKAGAKQQDAVLSTIRDGCSLNIVADGVGGSVEGEIASAYTISTLNEWFKKLDLSQYINCNRNEIGVLYKNITNILNEELRKINDNLLKYYKGCSTTVVLALVFPQFSVIMNIGDSLAFAVDIDGKDIHTLSTLDSLSNGLSYEEARHNENNNIVTNYLGNKKYEGSHSNLLLHTKGKKILLTSDGITDLTSEDNLEEMIINNFDANKFVEKAKNNPDVTRGMKSVDNMSAISIEVDAYDPRKRRM